jgi:hypothetical protein
MSLAACANHDPEWWFPSKTGKGAVVEAERAQSICAQCPVRKACEQYAKDHQIPFGVWGGVYRRYDAISTVCAPFAVEHGTNKGYRWHIRRKQTPCDECRIAHRYACAEYQKRRRA